MNNTSQTGRQYIIGGLVLIFAIFPFAASPLQGSPDLLPFAMLSMVILVAGVISLIRGLAQLQKEGRLTFPEHPKVSPVVAALPGLVGAVVSIVIIDQAGLLKSPPMMFWTFFVCSGIGAYVGLYIAGLRFGTPQR